MIKNFLILILIIIFLYSCFYSIDTTTYATAESEFNQLNILLEDDLWKNVYLNNCQYTIINNKKVLILQDNEYPFNPNIDLLVHFNHDKSIESWKPFIGNYNIVKKNFKFSQVKKVFGKSSANFISSKHSLILEPTKNSIFLNKKFLKSFTIEFWIYPSSLANNQYILQYLTPKIEKDNLIFSELKIQLYNKKLQWKFNNIFQPINTEKNVSRKSLLIESRKFIELEKWSHHALVFNHTSGSISYFINGKKDFFMEYPNHLVKFNSNKKSILIIGENLIGYLDEFTISRIAKSNYKKTIFNNKSQKSYSSQFSNKSNVFHISPYVNKSGFIVSPVYDIKSSHSFLHDFKVDSENPSITSIQYEYRIKNSPFQFNEIETINQWKSFDPSNFKPKKINGRYFQWRAILKSDNNGKSTPILKKLFFEFLIDKIPSKPREIEVFQSDNTIILSWERALEKDIKFYNIYYGFETENYFLPNVPIKIDANDIPSNIKLTYTIDFLEKGKTYFFSITAVDSNNQESDFSKEVYLFLK